MNWDAVGLGTDHAGVPSWVLVEAKANIPELRSDCGAGPESMARIRAALDETKQALMVTESRDWTQIYYQHANRLAVLHFLAKHGISAHMVDVFFYGSTVSDHRSPSDREGWTAPLEARKTYLGLTGRADLEIRVHHTLINIAGAHTPSTR
jgi:hypothetical protein